MPDRGTRGPAKVLDSVRWWKAWAARSAAKRPPSRGEGSCPSGPCRFRSLENQGPAPRCACDAGPCPAATCRHTVRDREGPPCARGSGRPRCLGCSRTHRLWGKGRRGVRRSRGGGDGQGEPFGTLYAVQAVNGLGDRDRGAGVLSPEGDDLLVELDGPRWNAGPGAVRSPAVGLSVAFMLGGPPLSVFCNGPRHSALALPDHPYRGGRPPSWPGCRTQNHSVQTTTTTRGNEDDVGPRMAGNQGRSA